MTLPVLKTWHVNELLTASMMNTYVRDPLTWMLETPTIKVQRSGNDSVLHQTIEAIQWNSEIWKDGITHSNSTNNTRLTIVDPGEYLVVCNLEYAAASGGQRRCDLAINGTTAGVGSRWFGSESMEPTSASLVSQLSVAGMVRARTGDYIQCLVYQSSGASLNVTASSTMAAIWMRQ